jgi:hypothetical protein
MGHYTDNDGQPIRNGDRIEFFVGIPGRREIATVRTIRRRLVAVSDDGEAMPLSDVLKYFPTTLAT